MDPITHMLTGSLVAQGMSKKNFIKQATWIGFLAGDAADLDFFTHSDLNPLLNLEIHRSFTHSFAFIPIGGILITLILLALMKSWRPRWKEVGILATIAYGTHSFMDALTSYGTELFWPFSSMRISWDILPIVAPIFTLILFFSVCSAYIMHSSQVARYGILISCCYIGFAMFQHHRAMDIQSTLQNQRHQTTTHQNRVLPRFASYSDWDSLYIDKKTVYLDTIYTPVGSTGYAQKNFSQPLFISTSSNIPSFYQSSVKTFIWFTQDYTTAISYHPLILADLRYVRKGEKPLALWAIAWDFSKKEYPMTWMRSVPLEPLPPLTKNS